MKEWTDDWFDVDCLYLWKKQDVFLMIRRKKTTIFTDAKETTNVSELKKIIQGITIFLRYFPEAYH